MSQKLLREVFEAVKNCGAWSLQLLQIQSKEGRVNYYCREITLEPEGRIKEFADELTKRYLGAEGIDAYSSVDEYCGDVVGKVIYKLQADNELISVAFNELIARVADPDKEDKIDVPKFHAYVLCGTVRIAEKNIPLKLFSMQSPLVSMTNRFWCIQKTTFREIKEQVLSLKRTIDVLILDRTVYMFTLAGERLFAMERAYKTVCATKVDMIANSGILADPEAFQNVAKAGHNPRRFVSYNPERFTAMLDEHRRRKFANKFGIALDKNNKIDTDDAKTSERLVKFLCNKGMLDPLDDSPVEVFAAKNWQ